MTALVVSALLASCADADIPNSPKTIDSAPAPSSPEEPLTLIYLSTKGLSTEGTIGTSRLMMKSRDGAPEVLATDVMHRSIPSLSPDGESVAFVSRGELRTLDLGSRTQQQLAECAPPTCDGLTGADWSPDGVHLAFSASIADREGIYVVDVDGEAEPKMLARLDGGRTPSWSPDGTRIAAVGGSGEPSIHVLNAETGSTEQVVKEAGFMPGERISWHPEADRLVVDGSHKKSPSQIFVIDLARGEVSGLTECEEDGCAFLYPVWSADGERIAVTKGDCRLRGSDCFVGSIMTMNFDGSEREELVSSPPLACCASWPR